MIYIPDEVIEAAWEPEDSIYALQYVAQWARKQALEEARGLAFNALGDASNDWDEGWNDASEFIANDILRVMEHSR